MKKSVCLGVVLCMLLPVFSYAQSSETPLSEAAGTTAVCEPYFPTELPRFDASISAGPISGYGMILLIFRAFGEGIGSAISKKPHDINILGTFSSQFYYQLKPYMQLGGKQVYEGSEDIVYTDESKMVEDYRFYIHSLSFMPSVRFTYLNKPVLRLYSGLDVGFSIYWDHNPHAEEPMREVIFAFDVTPLGMQVGKKFYGLLETNVGTDSFIKIGAGYRFR